MVSVVSSLRAYHGVISALSSLLQFLGYVAYIILILLLALTALSLAPTVLPWLFRLVKCVFDALASPRVHSSRRDTPNLRPRTDNSQSSERSHNYGTHQTYGSADHHSRERPSRYYASAPRQQAANEEPRTGSHHTGHTEGGHHQRPSNGSARTESPPRPKPRPSRRRSNPPPTEQKPFREADADAYHVWKQSCRLVLNRSKEGEAIRASDLPQPPSWPCKEFPRCSAHGNLRACEHTLRRLLDSDGRYRQNLRQEIMLWHPDRHVGAGESIKEFSSKITALLTSLLTDFDGPRASYVDRD